jgi:hypothetical protein
VVLLTLWQMSATVLATAAALWWLLPPVLSPRLLDALRKRKQRSQTPS